MDHGSKHVERIEMKISSKDFRVKEGDEVNLKKWPTKEPHRRETADEGWSRVRG